MQGKILAVLLILIIFLLCGLVYVINLSHTVQEGFIVGIQLDEAAYNKLRRRLVDTMTPYCELSGFIEDQMKTIYMTPKSLDDAQALMLSHKKEAREMRKRGEEPPIYSDNTYKSPGDSEPDAIARIQRTYNEVYNCRDELAKFRPSTCKVLTVIRTTIVVPTDSDDQHVPCSVYLDVPEYDSDDAETMAGHLLQMPDNLATLIIKEIAWYDSVMNYLQQGIDAGNNPPPKAPNQPKPTGAVKSWNADGEPFDSEVKAQAEAEAKAKAEAKKEGFANKCSSKGAKMRRQKVKKSSKRDSANCKMPSLSSEIKRVNNILDSGEFRNAMAKCTSMLARARRLKSDLEKLKNEMLYDWQKAGPNKEYASFKGGDRSASFVASLKQNT